MSHIMYFVFNSIGPAEALFEEPYYRLMKQALKPGGIVCTQGESIVFCDSRFCFLYFKPSGFIFIFNTQLTNAS